jgi:catechol 2,3-dioxygenase-like lactoylglutathione lyase family enzyme
MFKEWRHRRAVQRVKPGDGRPLKRFRWWQMLTRALFHLRLMNDDGRQTLYAVDVKHQNASDGYVKAHLYLDGRHHAESRVPAVFPVQGGTVEVRASAFGLKRCHYVTAEGAEFQLVPDPGSAEGRRARLDRSHPALSLCMGFLSVIVLVIGLALLILQLAEQITRDPEGVAQYVGTFISPIDLSAGVNAVVGLVTVAASTERALRLRYNWLLDGGAG